VIGIFILSSRVQNSDFLRLFSIRRAELEDYQLVIIFAIIVSEFHRHRVRLEVEVWLRNII